MAKLLYFEIINSLPNTKLSSFMGEKHMVIVGSLDICTWFCFKLLSLDWYFKMLKVLPWQTNQEKLDTSKSERHNWSLITLLVVECFHIEHELNFMT